MTPSSRSARFAPLVALLLASASGLVSADNGNAPLTVISAAQKARLAAKAPKTSTDIRYAEMSTPGAVAAGVAPPGDMIEGADSPSGGPAAPATQAGTKGFSKIRPFVIGGSDKIVHTIPAVGGQAETSVAINTAGTVVLAGYNDARGFQQIPSATAGRSLSGIARSTDGGATWQDGPSYGVPAWPVLPSVNNGQVFGDADIKYDALNNRWFYASIYVRPSDALQGLSVHRSTDDGATWSLPFEVSPAFVAANAADKEFMDVDPVTGKILISWTNFPNAGSATIRTTFSTDGGATWSAAATVGTTTGTYTGVQGSIPRFGPGPNVYCTWRATGGIVRNTGFSRSTDGGITWSAQTFLTTDFNVEDQILGVDRVNTSPSMSVDLAAGPGNGNIYITYQANNSTGEGDVAFQRSTDAGLTFSARALIDSNPGADRAQFYPWIAVDQSNHRVHAVWYDQESFTTGDMTQQMHTSSTDGGITWKRPIPLVDRPFHAGYGNDTSQPNVGDYNQNVAANGFNFTTFGGTSVAPRFDEGQCAAGCGSMNTPDTYFDKTADATNSASIRLAEEAIAFVESNCVGGGSNFFLDPLEIGDFTIPLKNYVVNPIGAPITYTGVAATLSTVTPNVTILVGMQPYSSIAPGATVSNALPYRVSLGAAFVPGTYIDFVLDVTTTQGDTVQLLYRFATASPGTTTVLLNETFTSIVPPALPAGWSALHGGGTTTVPWVTDATFMGGNAAFHAEAGTTGLKFERLVSPIVVVPASASPSYVELEFDLLYKLENEPLRGLLAYDGLTVRITDNTTGATLRSVLAEAFAEKLKTGTVNHFPKHLPRNGSAAYFQDMSVWSGDSAGVKRVFMKLPGAGLTGRSIQLRFEYTEDSSGVCTDVGITGPCGVGLDNVVIRHIVSADARCAPAPVELTTFVAE